MKLSIRMLSSQASATDSYAVSWSIESYILLVDNLFGRRTEKESCFLFEAVVHAYYDLVLALFISGNFKKVCKMPSQVSPMRK